MSTHELVERDRMALAEMPNLCARFKNGTALTPNSTSISVAEGIDAVNGFFKYLIPRILTMCPTTDGIMVSQWFSDPVQKEKLCIKQLNANDIKILLEAIIAVEELIDHHPKDAVLCGVLFHKELKLLLRKTAPTGDINLETQKIIPSIINQPLKLVLSLKCK